MGIARQHRLDAMAHYLGQIGVVDSGGAQMRHVAVPALVGANVEARGILGRLPNIAVEGALAPEAAAGGWEEELAVGAVEVDLGFEEPGEGGGDGDYAAGVLLAVVGLGALEDSALVSGAANLEGLSVEVFGSEIQVVRCDLDVTSARRNATESPRTQRNVSPA
jgi:hypothetical protein